MAIDVDETRVIPDDIASYHLKRAARELDLAERAENPIAAFAHRDLAQLHERAAQGDQSA